MRRPDPAAVTRKRIRSTPRIGSGGIGAFSRVPERIQGMFGTLPASIEFQ